MERRAERFLVDEAGNRVRVLLDIAEYQSMLEQLEELESIRAYDLAKASGESHSELGRGSCARHGTRL